MAQHTLFHFMGMSAVFEMLEVDSEVTIGSGPRFIAAIITLYLLPHFDRICHYSRWQNSRW